jgi:ComF family protein
LEDGSRLDHSDGGADGRYLSRLGSTLRALSRVCARQALDLAYPPSCLACARSTADAGRLCASCWRKVRFIERPLCERLGVPLPTTAGTQQQLSPEAVANPPVFARARAVARFEDGPVRDLVHRLKYGDRLDLARPMGLWMARAGAELLRDADLVLPVPLHRLRLWSRKFNQAAALATACAAVSRTTVDPFVLQRVKATVPQVDLTRAQRAENVQGAFRVPDEVRPRLLDRRILLVDDVLTSGATLNAASRTLLRAGARSVDVLVFARVVTGG